MTIRLTTLVLISSIAIACGATPAENTDRTEDESQLEPVATESVLTMGEDEKNIAITAITGYEVVKEAAITQKGTKFSLVVIVSSSTNENTAKDMGDNFVRLVKSFGPDESPLKEIGKGKFDYVIGVYYPDKTKIVSGAKNRNATKLTW